VAKELILLGGGGHCRSCIDVIEAHGGWNITGILDLAPRIGERMFGHQIIGTDDDVRQLVTRGMKFLITVGQIASPDCRVALYDKVQAANGQLVSIVSPLAYVSPRAELGPGTIVMHGAIVNCGARIGANVIINSKALIEHDAEVGDHCHISTAAIVNGGAAVGSRTFIGSNAVLLQGVRVPAGHVVAAGATYRAQA
jgi:sugar O-acyltransferase (sialic acid O-acetyltransferase NeuD family)